MSETVNLLQLYPRDMNIYGDWGNTLTLKRRLEWRGYGVNLLSYDPGDPFPDEVDLIVGGGGQDSGQSRIGEDLQTIGPRLRELADDGLPMLVVCGLYQQFGHGFRTREGANLTGIGVLDVHTTAGPERLIGNIVVNTEQFGQVIGYENHSGLTTLGPSAEPLGTVVKGMGNNTTDATEGARYRNVVGTYLHGSVLPKNPRLADWLLEQACVRRFGSFDGPAPDDTYAQQARDVAVLRPR